MKPHQGEKQTEKASNIKLGKGEFLVKRKKNEHYVKEECYLYQYNVFALSRSLVVIQLVSTYN